MKDIKPKNLYYGILLLVTFLMFFIGLKKYVFNHSSYIEANNGFLDISSVELNSSFIQPLEGQWRLYSDKLLEPGILYSNKENYFYSYVNFPSRWQKKEGFSSGEGYGTFVLTVKTKDYHKVRGLRIPAITSAFKLWIDDKLVASSGVVGTNYYEEIPRSYAINTYFYQEKQEFNIILQTSNFNHKMGGLLENIEFGSDIAISNRAKIKISLEVFLVGAFFIVALYNFALYSFKKKNKSNLYFAIVNILIALRTLLAGEKILVNIHEVLNHELFIKLEYLTLCLSVIFFIKFFRNLYSDEFSLWFDKTNTIILSLYISIIIFTKARFYSNILILYQYYIILVAVYSLYCIIVATIKKRELSLFILLGAIIFSFTVLNDLLYYMGYIKSEQLSHLGLFVFISIQTFTLSVKYTKTFSAVEFMSERLLLIDKLKDEFIENTSNQLIIPLRAVREVVESSILNFNKDNIEGLQKNLKLISSSTNNLINIVNNLHDFSKIKGNDIVLNKKIVDINQILELVMDLLSSKIKEKNIKIINNISKDIEYIYVDENRFTKILMDVIEYMIKDISKEELEIFCTNIGDTMSIHILNRDSIRDKRNIINLLKPLKDNFVTNNDKDYEEMTLEIAKSLIFLHGGDIRYSKDEVVIYMPVVKEKEEGTSNILMDLSEEYLNVEAIDHFNFSSRREINKSGEFKILIADDDEINVQVLINQLSYENYSLTIVNNGREVINLIEKEEAKFDLLILDSMMPKLSGFEVCKRIRKKYSLFDLPVLMLMTKNNVQEISLGFEFGANDYMIKPFSREELLARVKTLLTLKDAIQHAIINAHNFESEKYGRTLAEKLREITGVINSTLDLKEVMTRLLESLNNIVPYNNACVMLKREDGLYIMAACNSISCQVDSGERVVGDNKLLNEIIEKKHHIVFDNLQEHMDEYDRIEGCGCFINGRSWIGIPLISHDNILGVLVLEHSEANIYQDTEVNMAIAFASQASIAIENAKLFGEIKLLAVTDPLSGLNNRRYFFELSEKTYEEAKNDNRPLSVIMLDVDHFKKVNDRYGHDVGDTVLKAVADVCKSSLRKEDILGRYGGEEFCITLKNTNLKEAEQVASRIRTSIENLEIEVNDIVVKITVSLGINELRDNHLDFRQILREADNALYKAKENGRNRVEVFNAQFTIHNSQ